MNEGNWHRAEGWLGSEIEDSFVMINIATGKYVSLNKTANAVWQAIEQPRSRGQIEDALQSRFAVPETDCRQAVAALLEQMRELQMAVQS